MLLRSKQNAAVLRRVRLHALLAMTFCIPLCGAQLKPLDLPIGNGAPKDASRTQFEQHVAHLRNFVEACKTVAATCSVVVGPDDSVSTAGPAAAFTIRWDWLRDALKEAVKAKPEDRVSAMDAAAAHLDELLRESHENADAAAAARKADAFSKAHDEAASVLSSNEFLNAHGPTWWDRLRARVLSWIGRIFFGVGELGHRAPWLGTLLEWLFFLSAAVGLLLFLWNSFARQRMQIAIASKSSQFSAWDREATDWASEADSHAANGQWREAVHCLYWAAIVRLEARRAWKHDPSRTPREYVRLLKAGSAQQGALRGLTGIFERVWYGLREANAQDYERARSLFNGLGQNAVESQG